MTTNWTEIVHRSDHIFTWTEPATLEYLAEQARGATLAVEIGTYMGRSARVMLDAGVGHLWCVDLFMVAGTQMVTEHFLSEYIQAGKCEVIVGDSRRGAEMLRYLGPALDLVFVDDGHATEDVQRDIRAFLPLLRPGGLLCGHDFDIPHNDVAMGVISSLPSYTLPRPRLWAYRKPL